MFQICGAHNARLSVTAISTNSKLFIPHYNYFYHSKKNHPCMSEHTHSHDNDHYGDTHPFDPVCTTLSVRYIRFTPICDAFQTNNPFYVVVVHIGRAFSKPLLSHCCHHHWHVERLCVHALHSLCSGAACLMTQPLRLSIRLFMAICGAFQYVFYD